MPTTATPCAIDNDFLVAIRFDRDDLPAARAIRVVEDRDLDRAMDELLRVAHRHALRTLPALVVREGLALIVAELAARVAVPAVAATGWLGVGPIPGPVGFGIALAAGLLADQMAVGLWDVAFDPHGRLIRVTDARLDALHALVREGSAKTPGLRPALERARRRARCRPAPGRAALA